MRTSDEILIILKPQISNFRVEMKFVSFEQKSLNEKHTIFVNESDLQVALRVSFPWSELQQWKKIVATHLKSCHNLNQFILVHSFSATVQGISRAQF